MEGPVHYWVPSIATSGLMIYTGDRFPAWRGNLFVGGLVGGHLARLTMSGTLVANLASLGFRFDGHRGWANDRVPTARDLTIALSHSEFDPRSYRRPASQAAMDVMWEGTTVLIEDHLNRCAPDLTVDQVNRCLGARATRLGELWDNWGRIRPVLVGNS
jgi:hypothetical protein